MRKRLGTGSSTRSAGRSLALAIGILAAAPAWAQLEAGTTYKIGWASDTSNYLSFVDEPLAKGMQVAIDELNGKGGIAGKVKIELDRRDMKSDPMLGATVVQELIDATAPTSS